MPFKLSQWVEIAAIISAITDVLNTGRDTYEFFYNRRKVAKSTQRQAILLQATFSTYRDPELDKIKKRIENCRDKFIKEGDGRQRAECLCSVLTDVKDGNGGEIPDEEWQGLYDQLKCN